MKKKQHEIQNEKEEQITRKQEREKDLMEREIKEKEISENAHLKWINKSNETDAGGQWVTSRSDFIFFLTMIWFSTPRFGLLYPIIIIKHCYCYY